MRPDFDKIFGVPTLKAQPITDDAVDMINDALGDVDASASPSSTAARHISDLADLIVESNPAVRRAGAIHWLLNNSNGHALLLRTLKRRVTTKRKEKQMTTLNADQWGIIAKGAPLDFVSAVEKGIVTTGDPLELTNTAARAAYPDLSTPRAFAKFVDAHPVMQKFAFAAPDPMSYMKTTELESPPQMSLRPRVAGGAGDFSGDAYAKLVELTNEQLRLKNLSTKYFAAEFARIYSDPGNAQLAAQERLQNRAGAQARLANG
jgi:hypothetical protein